MDDKFSGQKKKLLSKGGKEILIKIVCSTIPIYAIACFRFSSIYQ